MPHVKANGISIYYEIHGQGEPVLYIGGTGGDLRAKPNVFDGPLSKTMEVLAYDQRGLGQTDKPETDYTMMDYADDVAALMDALGWDQANVVGVSFGGMVALQLVLRHPQRVQKLVLCCTSPGGSMQSYPFHDLPADLSLEQRTLQLMGVNDTRRDEVWQKEHPEQVQRIIDYTVEHAIPEHQTERFRSGALRQIMARAGHNVHASLSEISVPTLICAGKYDGIAPPENQEAMLSAISGSQLQWFEGGHLFLIQDKSAWPATIEYLQA
jgi:3-oxoadipate enol-lactonase